MREQFEEWYLAEYYEGCKECGLEWLSTELCGGYRYAEPAREWKVWQASRAALVIELPPVQMAQRSDEEATFSAGGNDMRRKVIKVIEACGVKATA
jgi:hypothetical protein